MNHPNRSTYSILRRRMAAEGLSLSALQDAIQEVLDVSWTYGVCHPMLSINSLDMFERLSYEIPEEELIVDGEKGYFSTVEIPWGGENCWVYQGPSFVPLWDVVRYSRKIVVVYFDPRNGEEDWEETWTRRGQIWTLVEDWSQKGQEREEQYGPALPPGIRQMVADKLEVSVTSTFHQAFDMAVETLS
jgi:hypothetical protein